jgi:multidrug efflux pump subunit AcrA (membrane-fusion protein)
MKHLKKFLIIIPVFCGIALLIFMKVSKNEPIRTEGKERVQTVRVIGVEKTDIVPRVLAYGYVQADRTWEAIPEVSGKVTFVHENLKKGHFIKQGELLLKIDTTSYGLAETKGHADLMNVDAKLKELEQSRRNIERLLATEKKSLAIASQELERKRELFRNGYLSSSDLEKEETNFLGRQTAVNNLQNSLDLIPSQQKSLLAQKKSGESTVSERQLAVAKTEIFAPFNCRLSAVNTELDQFAQTGMVLLKAESVDRAEIPVQLTPLNLLSLMPEQYEKMITDMPDVDKIRRAMAITAKIRLKVNESLKVEWDGWFSRTSDSLDLKTGTLTAYITVDNPYENVIPGKRPPLLTNMYVEVTLKGRTVHQQLVVPRSAVHDSRIFICNQDNRLEIRPVTVKFHAGDLAVIDSGLEQGQILVLSDVVPAINGMRLKPVVSETDARELKRQALGEAL